VRGELKKLKKVYFKERKKASENEFILKIKLDIT
jgi:hypothetical protein